MVVRSKRGTLLVQSALVFAAAIVIGWVVEEFELLGMTRLSGRAGVPVAWLFFAVVGLVVAVTVARDYWRHRITFEDDRLRIDDAQGTTWVRYDEIAQVRRLRAYGAGLRLAPDARWLATFQGHASELAKKKRLSTIGLGAYGCEVTLPAKALDVGVDRFVEELRARVPGARGVDPV
jgi:hypothetical protein